MEGPKNAKDQCDCERPSMGKEAIKTSMEKERLCKTVKVSSTSSDGT